MDWRSNCAVVIPCLNEQSTIAPLVRAVGAYFRTVYVVDDGSTDNTSETAREAGAIVLRHETNLGKGAALRFGWERAREAGFGWVLTLDGDGQHSAEDIPSFFECVEERGAALVVGNRMPGMEKMPWLRRHVNRWMSSRLSRLAGQRLPDSQCGYRLMRLEAWAKLPIATSHFEIESDVLLAFLQAGYRVEFVPVQVIYKTEQSKIHPIWDSWRWLSWWREAKRMKVKGGK
jgi:glycosyltransferase involved in cell wall biosynthesis